MINIETLAEPRRTLLLSSMPSSCTPAHLLTTLILDDLNIISKFCVINCTTQEKNYDIASIFAHICRMSMAELHTFIENNKPPIMAAISTASTPRLYETFLTNIINNCIDRARTDEQLNVYKLLDEEHNKHLPTPSPTMPTLKL